MSNNVESTIFGKMTSREAGKRKIKPTAVLYETLMHDHHDSDEEDEDFTIKMESEESTASGSASESNSDEEEDEDEEEVEDEEKEAEEGTSTQQNSAAEIIKICSVCINSREDDLMQCDGCGVIVHENCYGGVFLDDDNNADTATTHWFCEPCMYGVKEPPFCEFCPSRYGAFKRSDVGGRWVHLTCALFTPGVAFSAVDILSGVSWQELGNSVFGKKSCAYCKDKIESRMGIVTRCESGLCKEHIHATCAQKLGLLVDETDQHNDETACIMRYFYCKKHSNSEKAKKEQKLYSIWEQQELQRITKLRRRKEPSLDELKNQKIMMQKLEGHFDGMTGVTINIPTEAIEKPRRARLLNTSSEFFDRFETKAMDAGKSREQFREPFFDIKKTNTAPIPIGYSKEYLDYMSFRDFTQIPEEEEKVLKLRQAVKVAKERQQELEKSPQIAEKISKNNEIIAKKSRMIDDFFAALVAIGDKKGEFDKIVEELGGMEEKKIDSVDVKRNSEKTKNKIVKIVEELRTCSVCEMTSDQHKITECDQCHLFYHIGCLNPPLTRLPKRSANCGWICEECNESDEEEEEKTDKIAESLEITTRSSRSRRPPNRLSVFLEH